MKNHPCLSCGACCAYFRISFHWTETSSESYAVPIEKTIGISPYVNAMIGTREKDPRCIALQGVIGTDVSCDIYLNRPGCCRQFKASYEDGFVNQRCEQARINQGLSILSRNDWPELESL